LQLRGPQQQQLQAQLAEEAINQQIIEETEAELGAINKSLHTVHEIFKDLASMVSQQQEQVTSIYNNFSKLYCILYEQELPQRCLCSELAGPQLRCSSL
jgi:hypothetical protein